jgi:dephospho-CoA kinase
VLDVPLLFETGGERHCDIVVAVSASATLQRHRALARPGMTPEKLAGILARQMPDSLKRRRADVVAISALGLLPTLRALKRALRLV